MTELPMTDNAARLLSGKHLLGYAGAVASIVGVIMSIAFWAGIQIVGPGARISSLEIKAANTATLVEGIAVKMCLDADTSVQARDNLARSGIPCEALFRIKGLRPGRM